MYKIYKLIAPDGRVYIGCTQRKHLTDRFNCGWGYIHNGSGRGRSIIAEAIVYFGWSNFRYELLEETESEEKASELEKKYIADYRSTETEFGFNTQTGGIDGYTTNNHFSKKMSYTHKSVNTEFKDGHPCFTCHPFICLENGKTYESRKEAEQDLGVVLSHIPEVCCGKRKKCKGYHFKYKEEIVQTNF